MGPLGTGEVGKVRCSLLKPQRLADWHCSSLRNGDSVPGPGKLDRGGGSRVVQVQVQVQLELGANALAS